MAYVVNEVSSAPSSDEYVSISFFIGSGVYCRVWYSRFYKTSIGGHLREDTHFVKAKNRN